VVTFTKTLVLTLLVIHQQVHSSQLKANLSFIHYNVQSFFNVHEIASPLRDLFSYSLRSGKVPTQWKLAHVCAVFKKADPQEVSNYRPISLLSVVSKVLERILHKYMFNFYRDSVFFSPFQCGFIPKDSTVN